MEKALLRARPPYCRRLFHDYWIVAPVGSEWTDANQVVPGGLLWRRKPLGTRKCGIPNSTQYSERDTHGAGRGRGKQLTGFRSYALPEHDDTDQKSTDVRV